MNAHNRRNENKEENLVNLIRFRFAPYWPLFIVLVLIAEVGAWLYLKSVKPIYSASASIIIKDEKKGAEDSKLMESLNISSSKKLVENEVEVLKARDLMKNVVTKLALYAPIYEKKDLKDVSAYTSSPVRIEVQDPDKLTPTKEKEQLSFVFNKSDSTILLGDKKHSLGEWVKTDNGTLRFVRNPGFKEAKSNEYVFTLNTPANVAGGYVQNLNIAPSSKQSTVLELTFQDESPNRAQDVLNELITSYTRWTTEEKNRVAVNAVSFIEERLKSVVQDLDSIERNLQKYKSQRGIVDLSEQGKLFLQNVGENDRKVGDISMQIAVLSQVENYLVKKGDNTGLVPSTVGLNDAGLSHLLQRLYDSELQYETLKKTNGENNPNVQAVAKQIEQLRPSIMESVRNQQRSLQASRQNLNATSGSYTSVLRTIPQQERVLLDMSRQQSIKSGVYSYLLQKREEAVLSSSSVVADSRIIDTAASSFVPISPKKTQYYFIAFVLALILGIIIVSLKEFFSNKILFRSEIESLTQLPIAAEITNVRHKDELVIVDPKKIAIAEQFRHLRASIGLYNKLADKQKLLITSSISGEGKSFIASNLGLSLAMSGKRVVLVDFDLRNPKTTATFGLQNEKGLGEYLEEEVEIDEIIRKIDIEQVNKGSRYSNLFIIPAGVCDKNPTELLLSERLSDFFTYLESQFDYILIDTSPVDAVIDAYILSEHCDKTLFVVRHGYTPKTLVQLFDKNSKLKGLKDLSIVFNSIKARGFGKNAYGYGYGYGYTNVYSYKNKQQPS